MSPLRSRRPTLQSSQQHNKQASRSTEAAVTRSNTRSSPIFRSQAPSKWPKNRSCHLNPASDIESSTGRWYARSPSAKIPQPTCYCTRRCFASVQPRFAHRKHRAVRLWIRCAVASPPNLEAQTAKTAQGAEGEDASATSTSQRFGWSLQDAYAASRRCQAWGKISTLDATYRVGDVETEKEDEEEHHVGAERCHDTTRACGTGTC